MKSGRQESNLLQTAYKTVASPLGLGPDRNRKRSWWESNPRHAILQIAASPLDHRIIQSRRWDSNPLGPHYEGGARPVEHRRHIRAIRSSQCWCRANSTEVQSLRPLPRAWLGEHRFTSMQGGRWESNPHNPGSQPGLAAALSSAKALQPGIEPGTRPSQGRVMSLSPSKQEHYPGQDSNLDLLLRREP